MNLQSLVLDSKTRVLSVDSKKSVLEISTHYVRPRLHFFVRLQAYFHLFIHFSPSFHSYPILSLFVFFCRLLLKESSVFSHLLAFGTTQSFSALPSVIQLFVSNLFWDDVSKNRWLFRLSHFGTIFISFATSPCLFSSLTSNFINRFWSFHWKNAGVKND